MLKLDNVSISFNGKNVFEDISFILDDKEKLGLIGRNGSGKSTLLKIISGQLEPDSGNIVKSKNYRIGYLEQHLKFTESNIVAEVSKALPEHEKDNFWDVEKMLLDLDFSLEDLTKNPNEFSGGWQIRLNLAKLLVSQADLLLLDEPTNYLDIISISWLKRFLINWNKAFIIVTHDKNFLNDVITHTLIIHRGVSRKITGNVDEMYEQIAEDEDTYEKTRVNENKKRAQIQRYIDRFRYKATLAKQVQSKIKILDKQAEKNKLQDLENLDFDFIYKPTITNKPFIETSSLKFGYSSDNILIDGLYFKLNKNDKVCIIGKNGKGKSTLLKLLNVELKPLAGNIDINPKVDIGYFGQMNINRLNLGNTIEEELWSVDKQFPRGKILSTAGCMMFSGDDYKKKICVLSGGEKSRVLLGKIILKPCNLLLLDEPNNHLDMESCEALIDAMKNFEGASITVTHNEEYLNNIATKLVVFDNGKVFVFEGGYQDFLKEIGWSNENSIVTSENSKSKKVFDTNTSNNVSSFMDVKKKKNKLENEIFDLELKIEDMLNKQLYNEISSLQKNLNDKYLEYEEIIRLINN